MFSGGSGTESDPYLVANAEDLNNVRNQLDAHFKQVADIDLYNFVNWTPIGENWSTAFRGVFEGNNHKISNIRIDVPSGRELGLFGYVINTTLKNIIIENIDVKGGRELGALAGYVETDEGDVLIENCEVKNVNILASGNGIFDGQNSGGLIGYIDAYDGNVVVRECSVEGEVTASGSRGSGAGGLIGYMGSYGGNVNIEKCYANVKVEVIDYCAGGLIGAIDSYDYEVNIYECCAEGEVTGDWTVGGLIGYAYIDRGSVTDCYAQGKVTGGWGTGGLIGEVGDWYGNGFVFENLYATGNVVSSDADSGGLIGYNDGATFTNCYYDSTTTGKSDTGKGEPKTTAQMKQQANFVGWDFENIWIMKPNDYPRLRAFFKPDCIAIPLKALLSNINIAR